MVNDTTKLLGLEGVQVTGVSLDGDGVPEVLLGALWTAARCCPDCGTRSSRAHSRVTTHPRDLPVGARSTDPRWRKRRWHCAEPACPRATFTERILQIPARHRLTVRLREAAGAAVADGGRTVLQSARDHVASWPIVNAAVHEHAVGALPETDPEARCLGIDETRRGKARWRWDEPAGEWEPQPADSTSRRDPRPAARSPGRRPKGPAHGDRRADSDRVELQRGPDGSAGPVAHASQPR